MMKDVRGLAPSVETLTRQFEKAQAEILQLKDLNENLVSRLLSLEAREKARAEKKDKAENMITAKAATRKYQTGNDPPLSWARVVANGIDSENQDKNRDDARNNIPERRNALFKGQG